jgi:hypothetical protein
MLYIRLWSEGLRSNKMKKVNVQQDKVGQRAIIYSEFAPVPNNIRNVVSVRTNMVQLILK